MTLDDQPQVITLRGDDVQKVNHAYGTNGIITELEIPLGPAYPWVDCIVTFTDFMTAARFGQALANADGINKKPISIHAWPIPSYFAAFRSQIQAGDHCSLLMVAESSLEPLICLVQKYGGTLVYRQDAGKKETLLEFTWNHTTLHARNVDLSLTYLPSWILQTSIPEFPWRTAASSRNRSPRSAFAVCGPDGVPAICLAVPHVAKELLTPKELELGIHAGGAETSLMLSILPQHVKMSAVIAEYPQILDNSLLSLEGKLPFAWVSRT